MRKKMEHLKEPVFTETDTEKVDALLYQAMFDEVIRLRKTVSRRERSDIRKFITEAYQLYAEKNLENGNPGTFQESMFRQNQEPNKIGSTTFAQV